MKIQKLDPQDAYSKIDFVSISAMAGKIDELVDAVNELHEARKSCDNQIGILAEQIAKLQHDNSEKANCQENMQPDYVTTTYMTDGHTKEYYGQKGASIITEYPLPEGYVITINEPETKGGDNE